MGRYVLSGYRACNTGDGPVRSRSFSYFYVSISGAAKALAAILKSSLETQIAGFNAQIAGLKTQIAGLKTQIAGFKHLQKSDVFFNVRLWPN
jgi:hypothetical protein